MQREILAIPELFAEYGVDPDAELRLESLSLASGLEGSSPFPRR
jgi:hypothetical protein